MGLEAGALLARSYRLLHTIGEGGMGRVWVAEHVALERRVAVKVLSDEAIQSQAALELFQREARATARVDSPHVVKVLDYDVTDHGQPFLVLELLDGETLEERVQRVGTMTLAEVRAVLEQTSHALSAAHACGILHRDVKAENLFLQGTARSPIQVKLLDFGIAQAKHGGGPELMGPIGTPQYMSPEQMLQHDLDERSDLFSLAVCVYYALTGIFPYQGDSVQDISFALSRGVFAPVTQLRTGVPRALDPWFDRSLAIARDMRFTSCAEMTDAFLRALEQPDPRDTPVSVELDALVEERHGWTTGMWKAIGAMAALAALLVGVHAQMTSRTVSSAHQPPPADAMAMREPPAPAPVVPDAGPVVRPGRKHHGR